MERHSLRRFYGRQILKGALFATTALVLPTVAPRFAFAQLAPNTTPQGGQVVGGAASITQGNASTTINQSSQNAAINWQSFDIGAAAKVQFNQPNASAIALNRVVGGNLSQINGQINANGQIVLINQSGVVFGKGSQVNAESVVVSTSDIATSDFMAGKLNFTGAPRPGAQIINNGNITARNAGLVGLVAPQVANNGLITTTLGRVILAGGSAFTLDLYGDQLISLDVTQAVRAVDVGGKLVPALVINNGAILADGGKITLTAQDADALVTQLINAGGTIRADTVGAQTGTISVQGVGGNISIAGNLLARGTAAGTKGGAVEAITTGAVSVAPGAVIDVSGNAGGGYAAIGTSIARAQAGPADTAAPKAASVDIAAGATIHADATGRGNAGTVTVLSTNLTTFAGAITGQGGPQGGNGSLTELSSDGVINLSGTVLDTAINGQPGEILLDPATLIVTIGGASSTSASSVSPNYLDSLGGNVVLQADTLLEVLSDINMTVANTTLSLVSGRDITIEASIAVNGSLYINATDSLYIGPQLNIAGPNTIVSNVGGLSADNIIMIAGSGAQINTTITASQAVTLIGSGTLAEGSKVGKLGVPIETISGVIDSPTLTSAGFADGDVFLDNANNIGSFGNFTIAGAGTLSLTDNEALLIGNVVASNATFISSVPTGPYGFSITGTIDSDILSLNSRQPVSEATTGKIDTGLLGIFGPGVPTSYTLLSSLNTIGVLQAQFIDDLTLYDAHILTIASSMAIGQDFLFEGAGIDETGAGTLNVPTFSATGLTGDADLTSQNTIATLAGFSGIGSFALNDGQSLQLTGNVSAEGIALTAPTLNLQGFALTAASGDILALTANVISTNAGIALLAPSGTIILSPLTATDAIDITAAAPSAGTLAVGAGLLGAVESSGLSELLLGGAGQTGAVNLGGGALTSINLGAATLDIETTGTIGQAAAILSLGTLAFNGAGYAETAGATLTAGLVTGNGGVINGNVLLQSAKNDIGTIANITIAGNHALSVLQTPALQAGKLTAATIALDTGALTLNGNISAAAALTLDSSGTIFQSAGTIGAGTLTGTAGGAITLGDANAIGTIGGVSAGGDILLDSAAFAIAGQVSTSGTLILEGGGATELSGSGIQAAALTSNGTAVTGAVNLAAGGNTITTLTDFVVSGTNALDLADTGLLTLGGTVSAGNASLTADTLALNGVLNVAGLLTVGSQNGLDQTGGTLNAGTLASAGAIAGGDVVLNDAGNTIAQLAGFTVSAGDFTLNTAGTLAITGRLDDTGFTALFTAGGLTETGAGAIDAATLAGTGTFGDVTLNGNNSIGALGAFDATGAFSLTDAVALTLTNDLTAGGINLADSLALDIDAALTASASGVALAAPSVLIDTGGTVDLATGNQVFSVAADSFANIGTVFAHTLAIAPFGIGQTIILGDAPGDLDLTADEANIFGLDALIIGTAAGHAADFISISSFSASSGIALVSLFAAGLIEDDGLLDANAIVISGGGFSQTGNGTVVAGTFEGGGVIDGNVSLGNTTNLIGILGPITLATGTAGIGTLALTDAQALTLAGNGIVQAATLNADGLDFTGNFSAATELLLASTGDITEDGGTITAGTLGGTINGAINLLGANLIGTLGALGATGNIAIGNAQFLDIAGLVSTTGTITLENTAGITELTGGTLIAGVFNTGTGSIAGALQLASGNRIGTLGNVALTGNFLLSNTSALIIAGTLDTPTGDVTLIDPGFGITETGGAIIAATLDTGGTTLGGNLVLTGANTITHLGDLTLEPGFSLDLADSGPLDIAGTIKASAFSLFAGGIVTETGLLDIGLFSGSIGGNADLTNTLNTFGTIANLTMGNGSTLDVADQVILTLAGTILAPGATFDAPSVVFDGVINAGSILALTGSTITSEGADGDIIAATLTSDGSVDGSVFLLGTNNIGTIENFTVSPTSTFAINNGTLLTVVGPLTGGFITLSATTLDIAGTIDGPDTTLSGGAITLEDSGAIIAANTLELHSTAGVTGGGIIDAGLLTTGLGSIAGALSFTGASNITTLGAMTIGGDALISDTVVLTIAGLLKLLLDGGTLALQDSAGITEASGGAIIAATLTSGAATDGNVILGGQNTIAALGNFAVATNDTLALTDTGILAIAGTVTSTVLSLDDTTKITETTGGLLDIGTLTSGTATDGNVFLGNTLNVISDIGNFNVANLDTLAVLSAHEMSLTGTINAPNATFSSGGLNIDGVLNIAGTLALGSTGTLTEAIGNGGVINAATGTLVSYGTIAGPAVLLADNQIGAIGNFAVNGGFTFNDGMAYVIAGLISLPGTSALTLEGSGLRETGAGGIDAGTLTAAGVPLDGDVTLNGANSIATLADFAASGDVFLADAQALTIAGTISAATLGLMDSSSISQSGGAILAGELTSDGGSIGAGATLTSTRNGIGTLGPFTARGGLALFDAKTLLIDGNINLGGTLALDDALSIDQTGGTIKAAALASAGGMIGGGASFGQNGNQIAAITNFTVAHNLYLNDDTALQLAGTIDAGTGLTLTAAGQNITQTSGKIVTGLLDLTGGTIALDLANSIAALGAVSATDLGVNGVYAVIGAVTAGTATITSPAGLAVSGNIAAAGNLALSANTLAQTAGTISGAGIQLFGAAGVSLAGVLSAGTLTVTSPQTIDDEALTLTAADAQFNGGAVTLNGANMIAGALTVDGGSISQTGGFINAADVTGSAAQGITLAGIINAASIDLTAGEIIETGAGNLAAGVITLTAGGIALSGAVHSSGDADLTGTDITLGGLLLTAGTINITAGGGLIETADAQVQAGTGAWRAGFASLAGANTFTTAFNLTAAGLPAHGAAIDMSGGVLIAPTASLAADGAISLDGTARVAGDLYLKAYGQISAGGVIAAGTLTGGVTGPGETARFTGTLNHIGTIGSFVMPDSLFILNDDGPLVLDGPLVADAVSLNVNGLLTLEGSETGGLFIHGQIDPKTAITPQTGDSVFFVTGANAGIVQTGTFFVDSGPLAGQYQAFSNMPATLFFIMSPDGNISFEPAPPDGGGLIAPSIAAVFSPGDGGTISGNADLLSLLLLNGKATNLTGMLDGLTGEAASGKGNVYPFPKPVYQFNACPIGSVNCIILPVETLPPGNPLQNFDIAQHKKKRLDKNVALPGVATRDF